MNCQRSHFHRWNAPKHTALIFADTVPGLVTITTSAAGIVEIFCYFSFVTISLPGTPQLYHLVFCLCLHLQRIGSPPAPWRQLLDQLSLLRIRAQSLLFTLFAEDFDARWNTTTLLQRAFSSMEYKWTMQQGSHLKWTYWLIKKNQFSTWHQSINSNLTHKDENISFLCAHTWLFTKVKVAIVYSLHTLSKKGLFHLSSKWI